jgi:hypothetical protein
VRAAPQPAVSPSSAPGQPRHWKNSRNVKTEKNIRQNMNPRTVAPKNNPRICISANRIAVKMCQNKLVKEHRAWNKQLTETNIMDSFNEMHGFFYEFKATFSPTVCFYCITAD